MEALKPTPFEQVVDWLDARTPSLAAEEAPVIAAAGRVLAQPVAAPADHPPAPVAAVDGYALQSAACLGASEYNPLAFRITDARAVPAGEAAAVASGETLPEGADTVVPVVDVDARGRTIDVYTSPPPGENVVAAGREAGSGETVMGDGRRLRAADVALLLELGFDTVAVVRRPRVCVVAARPARRGSGAMIESLVERDGGVPETVPGDGPDALGPALAACESDLLLIIGGSGLGANDHSARVLAETGELAYRGVAISPGETATLGRIGERPVVVLPGPPLAALFAYDALAGRAVRRLGGRDGGWPYGVRRAVLSRKIASGLGRLECCRVRVSGDRAEPIAVADNRTLSTAVRADGFVLVASHSEGYAEGSEVAVYMYDQRY